MPNKERANKNRSKGKGAEKKRALALNKKRLTAASTAQADKAAQLSKQAAEAAAAKVAEQAQSKKAEQTPSKGVEQQSQSKRANHSEEIYRKLNNACAKSKHLAGQLSQQRSGLQLNLPASLPSSLIFRALNKEAERYTELRPNRIATRDERLTQLELLVDGMSEEQLTKLIEELDELIGDFTGRS